jgi:predicted transposase YdaD
MPGQWDDSLKLFISENPQDFATWLLGEAQVKVKLLTEFKTRTYESVELGKLSTETLRRTGLAGLLPLLILTKDGATREVVEEVISGLQVAEKKELLPITQLLASLVFDNELDREWIIWRFDKMSDILRETWAYQEIMKEGELKARHRDVLDVIQARFPEILLYAKKQIAGIQDTELLRRMNVKMSTVQTAEEALQYLFTIDREERETDTDHDGPAVSGC